MPWKRDKQWYTNVVYRYVDSSGVRRERRIRRRIGTRRQDAADAEVQIRAQIAAGTFDPEPKPTEPKSALFAAFALDEYLPWSQMQHSAKHHSEHNRMIERQLIPFFVGQHLHEISAKRIEDYKLARKSQRFRGLHWKKAKKISPATVNRELSCIKAIFRQAVRWGRLERSPASGIPNLKEPPNPPALLSQTEVARLIDCMPGHLRAAVGCAVYAGLRKMEILQLQWEDVDLKVGMLVVVSRAGRTNKSNKDRRIPINAELEELLRQHPRRLGSRYLFPDKDGEGHLLDLRKAIQRAAGEVGIEKITVHQLRHAFCSHAQMAGVDPRTVQAWMGHKDLRTTTGYAHTSPDHEREAIQRLKYRASEKQAEADSM